MYALGTLCHRRSRKHTLDDLIRRWENRRLPSTESLHEQYMEDDHSEQGMTREDLICAAVAEGNAEILRMLAEAGLWDPQQCVDELQAADEAGTLLQLCKTFYFPQALCPTLAHLQDTCEENWTERAADDGEWRPVSRPTPPAMLLANLITVACPVLDEVMEGVIEEMVVFLPAAPGKPPLPSTPLHRDFPRSLGAVFLRPTNEAKNINIRPDQASKGLVLEHWPYENDVAEISELFDITLDSAARRAALIPKRAAKFAYVYEQKHGLPGGFVYARQAKNGSIQVLEVNCIDFNVQGHALSCGESEPLSAEACEELTRQNAWYPVSVGELKDKGAIKYAFLGPNQKLADFHATPGGGFVFLFAGDQGGHYFPILGAGKVMTRAEITETASLNTAVLDEGADGRIIQGGLAQHRRLPSCQRRRAHDLLASFARLRVPGVLHPVVLHSLATTPRPQVLTSKAAQAITQAAYNQHNFQLAIDIALEAASLVAITMITSKVRSNAWDKPKHIDLNEWDRKFVFSSWNTILMLVWFKRTFDELCVFLGFCYQGWMSDYFTWGASSFWLYSSGLFACLLWLTSDLFEEFDDDAVRPLIAAVGAANWIRLLWALRGTSAFSLGPRILPIIHTLGEMINFVLVTVFFTGACAHVSFALSGAESPLTQILFSSYRLGFLADFDIPQDILFLHDEDDEPFSWSCFQYAAFIVFSFVVSISVTNIFIGVMSNAFDYHSERVCELFVRTRASMALKLTLRRVGLRVFCRGLIGLRLPGVQKRTLSQDFRLWFCYKSLEEDQVELTMRGAVKGMRDSIMSRFDQLEELYKMGDVAKRRQEATQQAACKRSTSRGRGPLDTMTAAARQRKELREAKERARAALDAVLLPESGPPAGGRVRNVLGPRDLESGAVLVDMPQKRET